MILTLLLTLCGLTSQKTHRGSLELSELVHEEAHPVSHSALVLNLPLKTYKQGSCSLMVMHIYM